jgi:hypothetical protein
MIISPKTIVINHRLNREDTIKSVSITHSCTCPFEWSSAITLRSDSLGIPVNDTWKWLQFTADTVGDHTNIPIVVYPSKMQNDTGFATIAINSAHYTYGTDTIHVIVYR